jgi:hypothetical protein
MASSALRRVSDVKSPVAKESTMVKWDYYFLTLCYDDTLKIWQWDANSEYAGWDLLTTLNNMGEQEWELVSVTPHGWLGGITNILYYFKRPRY